MANLRIGDIAPDFNADTTNGKINFYEYLGKSWGILFSHPGDFTPVCTTELGVAAKLQHEFHKRNTKIAALSIDPLDIHYRWINDINETQDTFVQFPIIADPEKRIAIAYDMIHRGSSGNDNQTIRSVFIIGPEKEIKLIIAYPASTGRSFHEILRVLDSLQLHHKYGLATPANWYQGQELIVPLSISDEDISKKYKKPYRKLKPYLRFIQNPAN